jgi:RNA polymerase sigma factor (sigma-70 family)
MARRDPLANPEQLLRRVYAYVAYRVRDPVQAEDITSETFERALRYRDRYNEREGDPIAWVLGIARNCVYDALLRPREEPLLGSQAAESNVEADVVRKLTLQKALDGLSGYDRELLALRYGADLRAREIARLLDQRTNAVEVALSRARARLAAALHEADTPHESRSVGDLADLSDELV